jgi:hypothetical protein
MRARARTPRTPVVLCIVALPADSVLQCGQLAESLSKMFTFRNASLTNMHTSARRAQQREAAGSWIKCGRARTSSTHAGLDGGLGGLRLALLREGHRERGPQHALLLGLGQNALRVVRKVLLSVDDSVEQVREALPQQLRGLAPPGL